MRTVYVNQIWGKDHEVARCWIVNSKTIEENLPVLFNKTQRQLIQDAIASERTEKEGGFHFITRFCQFVLYFNYDATIVQLLGSPQRIGISIELLNFHVSPNVNDIFDYMLKLRAAGWEENCREEIIRIGREIKKDVNESHFEIADMRVKDPIDDFNSYL